MRILSAFILALFAISANAGVVLVVGGATEFTNAQPTVTSSNGTVQIGLSYPNSLNGTNYDLSVTSGSGLPLASGTNTYVDTVSGTNRVNVPVGTFATPTDLNSASNTLYGQTLTGDTLTSNAIISYVNTATNGFVTAAITNGLAPTNYINPNVITNHQKGIFYVDGDILASNMATTVFGPSASLVGDPNVPFYITTNAAWLPKNDYGAFTFDGYLAFRLGFVAQSGQYTKLVHAANSPLVIGHSSAVDLQTNIQTITSDLSFDSNGVATFAQTPLFPSTSSLYQIKALGTGANELSDLWGNTPNFLGQLGETWHTISPSNSTVWLWGASSTTGTNFGSWSSPFGFPGGITYAGMKSWYDTSNNLSWFGNTDAGYYWGAGPVGSSAETTTNTGGTAQPGFHIVNYNPSSGIAFIELKAGMTNSSHGIFVGTNIDNQSIYLPQYGLTIGMISDGYNPGGYAESQQSPSFQWLGSDATIKSYFTYNGQRTGDTKDVGFGQVPIMVLDPNVASKTDPLDDPLFRVPYQVKNVWMTTNANWRDSLVVSTGSGRVDMTNGPTYVTNITVYGSLSGAGVVNLTNGLASISYVNTATNNNAISATTALNNASNAILAQVIGSVGGGTNGYWTITQNANGTTNAAYAITNIALGTFISGTSNQTAVSMLGVDSIGHLVTNAVPTGGGGGSSSVSNLLNQTLSFWGQTNVTIDMNGFGGVGTLTYKLNLTTNAYFYMPSNLVAGLPFMIELRQDSIGSHTVSFNTNYWKFPSGNILIDTTNANSWDVISCEVGQYGTNIAAVQTLNFQ